MPSRTKSQKALELQAQIDREIEAGLQERLAREERLARAGGAVVADPPSKRRGDYGTRASVGYSIGRAPDLPPDPEPEAEELRASMGGAPPGLKPVEVSIEDMYSVMVQQVLKLKENTESQRKGDEKMVEALKTLESRLESQGTAMMLVGRSAKRAGMSFSAWMQHCFESNLAPWHHDRRLPNKQKGEWSDAARQRASEHMKEVWRRRKAKLAKLEGDDG